jgi:hypothetical protein
VTRLRLHHDAVVLTLIERKVGSEKPIRHEGAVADGRCSGGIGATTAGNEQDRHAAWVGKKPRSNETKQ